MSEPDVHKAYQNIKYYKKKSIVLAIWTISLFLGSHGNRINPIPFIFLRTDNIDISANFSSGKTENARSEITPYGDVGKSCSTGYGTKRNERVWNSSCISNLLFSDKIRHKTVTYGLSTHNHALQTRVVRLGEITINRSCREINSVKSFTNIVHGWS